MSTGQPTTTHLCVVGAAILDEDRRRCLVTQRSCTMSNPLKWEFPGGKVEPGEHPRAALEREILEELGVHIDVGPLVATSNALLPKGRAIQLEVFWAHITHGTLELTEHARYSWCDAAELQALDWADADVPAMTAIATCLQRGV